MKQTQGFTVVELMIVIVIAGVLLAAGIPGFISMARQNAVTTTSNELLNSVLLARSEAVRQEQDVTLTPSATGWQVVDEDGDDIQNKTVDNRDITIVGANPITYNPRGRTTNNVAETIAIQYEGTNESYLCLSLTGRPYIKSAEEGTCP